MESTKDSKEINIKLSDDEAIVLLEWLSEFNKKDQLLLFQDQAEQRILFDLECILEKVLSNTFEEDYLNILSQARKRIRDID